MNISHCGRVIFYGGCRIGMMMVCTVVNRVILVKGPGGKLVRRVQFEMPAVNYYYVILPLIYSLCLYWFFLHKVLSIIVTARRWLSRRESKALCSRYCIYIPTMVLYNTGGSQHDLHFSEIREWPQLIGGSPLCHPFRWGHRGVSPLFPIFSLRK